MAVQAVVGEAGQHRRPRDLGPVEVEDGQHDAVASRVQERPGGPGRGQRARLGLAVADHAGHQQVGVVEGGPGGVGQGVAQLAALVDRPGGGHADVAGHPAGGRELAEQPEHALLVPGDLGVDLAVGALQPHVGQRRRAAVARAAHEQHLLAGAQHEAVEVGPQQVQPRARAPVPEQAGLDVVGLERPAEQRVVLEEHLADREVVGRPPPGVDRVEPDVVAGGGVGGRGGHRVLLGRVTATLGSSRAGGPEPSGPFTRGSPAAQGPSSRVGSGRAGVGPRRGRH